jgi:hypothetical protein
VGWGNPFRIAIEGSCKGKSSPVIVNNSSKFQSLCCSLYKDLLFFFLGGAVLWFELRASLLPVRRSTT